MSTTEATVTDHDKMVAKIEALLRKAESTTHPAEAEAFTAKANELMQKWAVSEAMLRQAKPAESIWDDIHTEEFIVWFSPTQAGNQGLISAIANAFEAKVCYTSGAHRMDPEKGKYRKCRVYKVTGMKEDLESIRMLYISLQIQAAMEYNTPEVRAARKRETDGYGAAGGGRSIKFQNSFMVAFATRCGHRIREMRREVRLTADSYAKGTALVLADQATLVAEKFKKDNPNLRAGSASNAGGSRNGRNLGDAAGRRANLGGNQISR